jgi:CRISPR-associated protein Csd2
MSPRALLVFKHDSSLGKAPSHTLFEKLQITSYSDSPAEDGKPAREFTDYASRITFDGQPLDSVVKAGSSKDLGNGITLIRRI